MKPKIILAFATGRPFAGKLLRRYTQFGQKLNALCPDYEVRIMHTAIPREAHALNMLVDDFRQDETNQWFCWLDPRIQISFGQLFTLLTSQVPVCGALFTTCEEPSQWMASFYPGVGPKENGVLPVPELAGGAKVFHRSVFDEIEKATPDLRYIYDNSGRSLYAFFQETIATFGEYKRLLPPAYHMDALCRKTKIDVFAHVGVIVKHEGNDGTSHPIEEPFRSWEHIPKPPPVAAHELPDAAKNPKPIAICIQYCDKDKAGAKRLKDYIANQYPTADVLMEYSPGDKYPKGPNETATRLLQYDWEGFKAVLLIEPDCVPVNPKWLDMLSDEWDRAEAAGKLIMGSWHPVNLDHPKIGHLNGNLMFSPLLKRKVEYPSVPDNKPWDTYLADVFEPFWCRTGLIKNLNRHRTATKTMLTKPECGDVPPVLIHGVRDESSWNLSYANAIGKTGPS